MTCCCEAMRDAAAKCFDDEMCDQTEYACKALYRVEKAIRALPLCGRCTKAPEPSALEIAERVREAAAKVCDSNDTDDHYNRADRCASAIRALDLPAVLSGMKEGK